MRKCKDINEAFRKRDEASQFVNSNLVSEVQTLREINKLRLDDVNENKAINKNKAMTIKAHII